MDSELGGGEGVDAQLDGAGEGGVMAGAAAAGAGEAGGVGADAGEDLVEGVGACLPGGELDGQREAVDRLADLRGQEDAGFGVAAGLGGGVSSGSAGCQQC